NLLVTRNAVRIDPRWKYAQEILNKLFQKKAISKKTILLLIHTVKLVLFIKLFLNHNYWLMIKQVYIWN
ncbi:MAG: hypothetical protein KKF89_05315, partial [Nanoarchaeota archaeon]|nr:hypothetical protein [Nanoarchaeota archaeon]